MLIDGDTKMANKKSDPNSMKSGDQIAKDEFIEDLDEEELKEIKGGISLRQIGNDTIIAGSPVKGGLDFNTVYGGGSFDTVYGGGIADTIYGGGFATNFDKLKR